MWEWTELKHNVVYRRSQITQQDNILFKTSVFSSTCALVAAGQRINAREFRMDVPVRFDRPIFIAVAIVGAASEFPRNNSVSVRCTPKFN